MKFRVSHLLIAMSMVAFLSLVLISSIQAVGGGDPYDLTVDLDATSAAMADSISYAPVRGEQMATEMVAQLDNYLPVMVHQDSADAFILNIGYRFRVYPSGEMSEGWQDYTHIVVVLHRRGRTRAVHLVEIPHGSHSRRLVVTEDNRVSDAAVAD
ncbi:hypothetical protein [Aeoliella sp.]|uniref:hypothetical protein n=1 Tax=Aeoliella sp. TaxID=2795800 RepID=UPI003CCC2827